MNNKLIFSPIILINLYFYCKCWKKNSFKDVKLAVSTFKEVEHIFNPPPQSLDMNSLFLQSLSPSFLPGVEVSFDICVNNNSLDKDGS